MSSIPILKIFQVKYLWIPHLLPPFYYDSLLKTYEKLMIKLDTLKHAFYAKKQCTAISLESVLIFSWLCHRNSSGGMLNIPADDSIPSRVPWQKYLLSPVLITS